MLTGAGTTTNVIEGDYIGTDSTGVTALSNRADGLDIVSGASSNTIGGTTSAARNVISGNGDFGLFIADTGTVKNLVTGNDIGSDATGAKRCPTLTTESTSSSPLRAIRSAERRPGPAT